MQKGFELPDGCNKDFVGADKWIPRADYVPRQCAMVFPPNDRLMDILIGFLELYCAATFVSKNPEQGVFTSCLHGECTRTFYSGEITATLFTQEEKMGIDVSPSNTMEIDDFVSLLDRVKHYIEQALEEPKETGSNTSSDMHIESTQEDDFSEFGAMDDSGDVWEMICEDTNPESYEEVCSLVKMICSMKGEDTSSCAQAFAANTFLEKGLKGKAYALIADCATFLAKGGASLLFLPCVVPCMESATHALQGDAETETLRRAVVLTRLFYDLISSNPCLFEVQKESMKVTVQSCLASCSASMRSAEPQEYLRAALCVLDPV